MAIELVIGHTGAAHVDADDFGGMNQGIFGTEDYVLGVGKKLAATLVTNNSIKIEDGEAVMQGRHFRIKPGTYESITIDNGAQGMRRKDLIVARYTKNTSNSVENVTLAVLKGMAVGAGTPLVPKTVKGDIRAGATKHEMPLYTVELNGINVVSVNPDFNVLMSVSEVHEELLEKTSELNNKLKTQNTFSNSEVETGETWIDGRKIYRKTLVFNDTINVNGLSIKHGIANPCDLWVDFSASYMTETNGVIVPLIVSRYNKSDVGIDIVLNKTNIRLEAAAGWNQNWTKVVTIKYTKL